MRNLNLILLAMLNVALAIVAVPLAFAFAGVRWVLSRTPVPRRRTVKPRASFVQRHLH